MKFCHGVQDIPKCTTHFHHDSSMKHNSPGDTETFNEIYKKKFTGCFWNSATPVVLKVPASRLFS